MRTSRLTVTTLTCTIVLSGAASAFGAHPKKSAHFSGTFAHIELEGFKAPVSFTVSSSGKALKGVTYSTLGCFGAGGFKPGVDYYTKPAAIIKVGAVKLSSSGRFSAKGVVFKYTAFGFTTTTTTTLSGRFTGTRAASGSVRFTQQLSSGATCQTSQALTFTAKAH